MGFFIFLLVTAIMIIRPTDFVPGLEGLPLYQIAIVPCILLSWHKLIPQLTATALRDRPVVVFGIGIILVSLASNFVHGQFQTGLDFAVDLLKMLLFYLLLLGHLDSPGRLRRFMGCLVLIILIPITLAVLSFHGYIEIAAIRVLEESEEGRRLCGTGVFNDPNDVCEIINCAMMLCLSGWLRPGGGLKGIRWLAPLVFFGQALFLTQSRGGFLGAMVGLMVLFRSRFRGMKPLVAAGAALALLFALFAGRQTSFSTSEGTGQSRIQLWDDGFQMLRSSPLIGVGTGQFSRNAGHVAHNAFIQTYAELGLLGGTLLFGQYFWSLKNMIGLASKRVTITDPEVRQVHPFLLAALAGYATSEMSLTNPFSLMTYLMLGLATVCIRLAEPSPPLADLALSGALVRRIIIFSGLFVLALYVFTRYSLQYG